MEIPAAISRSPHPRTGLQPADAARAHRSGFLTAEPSATGPSAGADPVAVPIVVDVIVQSEPHPPTHPSGTMDSARRVAPGHLWCRREIDPHPKHAHPAVTAIRPVQRLGASRVAHRLPLNACRIRHLDAWARARAAPALAAASGDRDLAPDGARSRMARGAGPRKG